MKRSSFLKSLCALGAALCVSTLSLFRKEEKVPKIKYFELKDGATYYYLSVQYDDIKLPSWVRYVKVCRTKSITVNYPNNNDDNFYEISDFIPT